MTEVEWRVSQDDVSMLAQVGQSATLRQKRLVLCGCARRVWASIPLERWRRAVEVAEGYVEGVYSDEERAAARNQMVDYFTTEGEHRREVTEASLIMYETPNSAGYYWHLCGGTLFTEQMYSRVQLTSAWQLGRKIPGIDATDVIRCIVGNPFRPVAFDPRWRTETAVALAAGIYEARAFDRLPILADALEDAGCDHAELLAHCRASGPHARGCWVVDLVLGRQ